MARSYQQFCGLAVALDRVGERWTLLIVRNLMVGPARYGEFMKDLPGITTNLLAKRLKEMIALGLLAKRRLPSPINADVYELTKEGRELEPIILALSEWGWRFLSPETREHHFNLRYALASMKLDYTPVPPPRGAGSRWTVQLTSGDRAFWMILGGDELALHTLPPGPADVVCHAEDEINLLQWLKGGVDLDTLTASGQLAVDGDLNAVEAFKDAFALS